MTKKLKNKDRYFKSVTVCSHKREDQRLSQVDMTTWAEEVMSRDVHQGDNILNNNPVKPRFVRFNWLGQLFI